MKKKCLPIGGLAYGTPKNFMTGFWYVWSIFPRRLPEVVFAVTYRSSWAARTLPRQPHRPSNRISNIFILECNFPTISSRKPMTSRNIVFLYLFICILMFAVVPKFEKRLVRRWFLREYFTSDVQVLVTG